MLAFLRHWEGGIANARRMADSLALHAPGNLSFAQSDNAAFALVGGAPGNQPGPDRRSIPATLPSGDRVLFTGWFDNLTEIAALLGVPASDPATVYGHAVERWGDQTELHVVGAYGAVIDRPRLGEVRLVRSPITAPPLHYHRSERMLAAACAPRALLALGLPAEIDEARLAMHLHFAPHDVPGGWYKGIEALQLGTVVTATRDGERRVRPYDPAAVPEVRMSDDEAQHAVEALLREAIERTTAGFRQTGVQLSGGLDSPLVASHTLDLLPPGQTLPSFTFLHDPDWQGEVYASQFPDERPYVEAFAAANPRIEPHFLDNAGKGFEDGLADLFLLAGTGSAVLPLVYPYHAVFAAARQRGCDVLLGAGMGNSTFSNFGTRGYVEYFRTGRWRQAWRGVANRVDDTRPMWRRFLSLCVLRSLPLPLWRAAMRLRGGEGYDPLATMSALNPDWPGLAAMDRAARQVDPSFDRPFYTSRADEVRAMAGQLDADAGDMMHAMAQRHGVAYRDVTRYRPLVELCWGLETRHYLWDGEDRRLARRMARGRLPEAQRTERRYGFQHADWHLRIGRRRDALLQELRSMQEDPDIARLVDTKRLIRLLETYPEQSSTLPSVWFNYMLAVPMGIAAGRFIRHVRGTNA
jgi:asparagine synthase (glutamine-hydrolysing)